MFSELCVVGNLFPQISFFWYFDHKINPFCILHLTPLKQSANGAVLGKIVKMHFLLQKHFLCPNCILSPKYIFGTQSDFWAKSAIWSKKSPLELSRTHIPLALFASGRGRTPKSGFLLQKALFVSKTHFGRKSAFVAPKCTFCGKCTFVSPCRGCL